MESPGIEALHRAIFVHLLRGHEALVAEGLAVLVATTPVGLRQNQGLSEQPAAPKKTKEPGRNPRQRNTNPKEQTLTKDFLLVSTKNIASWLPVGIIEHVGITGARGTF